MNKYWQWEFPSHFIFGATSIWSNPSSSVFGVTHTYGVPTALLGNQGTRDIRLLSISHYKHVMLWPRTQRAFIPYKQTAQTDVPVLEKQAHALLPPLCPRKRLSVCPSQCHACRSSYGMSATTSQDAYCACSCTLVFAKSCSD